MKPFFQKLIPPPTQSVIFYDEEKPHFTVPWHFHPEIEVLYVMKSSGMCYSGDGIHHFTEGEISIIGENVPHWWKSDDVQTSGMKALIIQFNKEIFGGNFIEIPETKRIRTLFDDSQRGIQFVGNDRKLLERQIIKTFKQKGIKRITELIILLDMMSRAKEYKYHSSLGYSKIINSYDFFRFNVIQEYIIKNFQQEIRINDVAEKANMSPTAFCRYFKQHTGKTFISFTNEFRAGHACKLIIDEKLPINIACIRSGFNNLSHFNHVFKKVFAMNPSDYVKAYNLHKKNLKEYSDVGIIN